LNAHLDKSSGAAEDYPGAVLLRTRRLVLRGLRFGDIRAIQVLNSDADVSRWLLEPCPVRFFDVAAMIAQANHTYQERPGLGIWHANDEAGHFVGLYSLMPVKGTDEIEIGARLNPEYWGRLYSIEGTRALCAHAFETLRLSRLVGFCDASNTAVPVIFRRLGFRAIGEVRHFDKPARKFALAGAHWKPATPTRAASTSLEFEQSS